jgi:hypothetical protein
VSTTTGSTAAPTTGGSRGFEVATVSRPLRQQDILFVPHLLDPKGKVTGHADVAWVPSTVVPPAGAVGTLAPGARRPVIVLLDAHVRRHPFIGAPFDPTRDDALAGAAGGEASGGWRTAVGWPPPGAVGPTALVEVDVTRKELLAQGERVYRTHFAHATYVTGLLRQVAPDARVLSVPVTNETGRADDETLADALVWVAEGLGGNLRDDEELAVLLLPYGRKENAADAAGDEPLRRVRRAVEGLPDGVTLVVSAGNHGSDDRVYPAFLADDHPPVVAVGALDARHERAAFSSHGPWVHAWEVGANLVSCLPFTIDDEAYVTWSGSSFAAAVHAGRLAQARAQLVAGSTSTAVEPLSVAPPAPSGPLVSSGPPGSTGSGH